jgi:hypothetical protein
MSSHANKNLSQFLNMECNESGMNVSSRFYGDNHCTASSWQVYFQKQFDENQRIINAQKKLMKESKAYLMTMQQRNASLQGTRSSELHSLSLQHWKNTDDGQEKIFMKQQNFALQEEYAHQCLAEFAPMLKSFFGGDDDESTASDEQDSRLSDADASWPLPENANSSMWQGQEGNTSNEWSPTSSASNVGQHRQSKIKYVDPPVDSSAGGEKKKAIPAKRRKKPKDMPRRPLSGYNLFFKDERAIILAEKDECARNGSDQKVGFERLAQLIGKRWKALSDKDKTPFKVRADQDTQRYRLEMIVYKEKLPAQEANTSLKPQK